MVRYTKKDNVYINDTVKIGINVIIYPNVVIEGESFIGDNTILYPGCFISNCIIGCGNEIMNSQLMSSNIGDNNIIGPFTYIRENTKIGNNNRIGSFVEIKKSDIKDNNKIPHHSYVGDAIISNNVNIGAGVIFANYDGKEKHQTIIKDKAFIGSNSTLIAPVTVNENAVIAADTTVTKDVPRDALAISRSRQINKKNYRTNRD